MNDTRIFDRIKPEDVPDLIEDAADYIEKNGWSTGFDSWVSSGPRCVEGALFAALDIDLNRAVSVTVLSFSLNDCPLGNTIREYIAATDTRYVNDQLCGWNDTPGRTKDEVLDTLRGAAKFARRQLEEEDVA